jgi:hypothetical protein
LSGLTEEMKKPQTNTSSIKSDRRMRGEKGVDFLGQIQSPTATFSTEPEGVVLSPIAAATERCRRFDAGLPASKVFVA